MCSKTTVAPLDRIKILLQAHSVHYKHLGVFSGLTHIVQKESFFALYKGNGAQMVGFNFRKYFYSFTILKSKNLCSLLNTGVMDLSTKFYVFSRQYVIDFDFAYLILICINI